MIPTIVLLQLIQTIGIYDIPFNDLGIVALNSQLPFYFATITGSLPR